MPSLIGGAAATAVVPSVAASSVIVLALLARDNRDNQQGSRNHHDDNRDEQILHVAGLRSTAGVRGFNNHARRRKAPVIGAIVVVGAFVSVSAVIAVSAGVVVNASLIAVQAIIVSTPIPANLIVAAAAVAVLAAVGGSTVAVVRGAVRYVVVRAIVAMRECSASRDGKTHKGDKGNAQKRCEKLGKRFALFHDSHPRSVSLSDICKKR